MQTRFAIRGATLSATLLMLLLGACRHNRSETTTPPTGPAHSPTGPLVGVAPGSSPGTLRVVGGLGVRIEQVSFAVGMKMDALRRTPLWRALLSYPRIATFLAGPEYRSIVRVCGQDPLQMVTEVQVLFTLSVVRTENEGPVALLVTGPGIGSRGLKCLEAIAKASGDRGGLIRPVTLQGRSGYLLENKRQKEELYVFPHGPSKIVLAAPELLHASLSDTFAGSSRLQTLYAALPSNALFYLLAIDIPVHLNEAKGPMASFGRIRKLVSVASYLGTSPAGYELGLNLELTDAALAAEVARSLQAVLALLQMSLASKPGGALYASILRTAKIRNHDRTIGVTLTFTSAQATQLLQILQGMHSSRATKGQSGSSPFPNPGSPPLLVPPGGKQPRSP